jgi:hypothetical protein
MILAVMTATFAVSPFGNSPNAMDVVVAGQVAGAGSGS